MKKILTFLAPSVFLFLVSCQQEEQEAVVKPNIQKGSSLVEEAFPGKTGTVEKGHLYGTPIEFMRINGQAVFQGDIILTPEQLINPEPSGKENARTEGAGRSLQASRWPNNLVYYTIDPALPPESRNRVANAIAHWQTNTQIRFATRPSENQADYVTFRPGEGCSAAVGKVGNQQFITISTDCTTGNIIHEIGHAVGLWHEQSRTDRDSYINILWENIESGKEYNFQTYAERGQDGFDHGEFDFNSIMMYGPYSFSANGNPTITKKDGSSYSVQRTALSLGDKAIINVMYPTCYKTLPCLHLVPQHPNGDKITVACIHKRQVHPNGDRIFGRRVPCIHWMLVHPNGDTRTIPCLHKIQEHPAGHPIVVPCT